MTETKDIKIRLEVPDDYRRVEELTRDAFWGGFSPKCDEHYLAHLLRGSSSFIPELDFVATANGTVVGNVMYSYAIIYGEDGTVNNTDVITFGPLSVARDYMRCGVGKALMKHSILAAKDMGFRGIVLHGHPDYYIRFGFRNAQAFGITNINGKNYDSLMALELYDGALDTISGRYTEDPVFEINSDDAEKYDLGFPAKEPGKMIPIEKLTSVLSGDAAKSLINHGMTDLYALNRVSGREMCTWDGFSVQTLNTVNRVLRDNGLPEKLLPDDPIQSRAALGIRSLELI